MSELFDIGTDVHCRDGSCGRLACVIVDPITRTVTHLVVEPQRAPGQGRLVPVDIAAQQGSGLRLDCSAKSFEEFEFAEETHFASPDGEELGYGEGEVLAWPYYGAGLALGVGEAPVTPRAWFESRVPAGQVTLRRGERIHCADGDCGRIHGFVVDPADHHITHLVIEQGGPFSRRKAALSIAAVTDVGDDGVTVALTRRQMHALPAFDTSL